MKQIIDDHLQQEEEYTNIIATSPSSVYESIDMMTVNKWKECLNITQECHFTYNESLIQTYLQCPSITKIIKFDCERTRVRERRHYPTFKPTLNNLIHFYCHQHKLDYKQGINEIIGPFLLLSYQIDISIDEAYLLFEAFISKYALHYFHKKDIYFSKLKISLYLFDLLLKYHEPSIYRVFESEGIQPEMYSLNWFMTVFSNKSQLDIVYHLWNVIILNDDPLFIHYLLLALIIQNKKMLFQFEKTEVLCLLSKMAIKSIKDCNEIIQRAFDLQKNTPFSFKMLYVNPFLFQTRELNINYRKIDPESINIMPIFPYEFTHLCLKGQFMDDSSSNNNSSRNGESKQNRDSIFEVISNGNGYHNGNGNDLEITSQIKLKGDSYFFNNTIPYLIYDLRNNCIDSILLPQSLSISNDLIEGNNKEIFFEMLKKDKGNYHIILLTTETAYFRKVKKANSKYSKEKLLQYDLFDTIHKLLIENEFPYVSYVYCGFKAVHQLIITSHISFPNHSEDKCSLCSKSKRQLEVLNKIIIDSQKNGLSLEDYSTITQLPLTEIFAACTLIQFNLDNYDNTPMLVVINDYVIAVYAKAENKNPKVLFEYIFSYEFKDLNGFCVSYHNQSDNILTLYFSYNEEMKIYENTLMIDFVNKKDTKAFYTKIMQKKTTKVLTNNNAKTIQTPNGNNTSIINTNNTSKLNENE